MNKMKKAFTYLLIMMSFSIFTNAQTARMILAEGFTSSTCGPCATQNPAFDALLHANTDKITSIKYHMSWPPPGNDPMYLHNTVDNNARRTYYSINSVPHVYVDGNVFHGVPSQINQAAINNWASDPAVFDIVMQHRISDDLDSVYVTMLIKSSEAVSGNLVAHIAVIEKEIHFATPPGTNGEKDFYNVMKALIPSRTGTALPNFGADEYVIVEAAWKLANVYNIDQIAAVGFVQNNINKYIYQAANSTTTPLQPFFVNDGAVKNIENATSVNCSGKMAPIVQIVNYGSAQMTDAVIDFEVNGEFIQSATWSGSLGFLETAMVSANEISFPLLTDNTLTAKVVSVNGADDDYLQNNSMDFNFTASPELGFSDVSLFILLNNFPEQNSWELLNSAGEIVQSGGPYTTPNSIVTLPLSVNSTDCYEFVMYDTGGNGLCCGDGLGYYAVLGSGSDPIFTGQSFGSVDRNQFSYGFVGINENKADFYVKIHPNPVSNEVTLNLELNTSSTVQFDVLDLAGRSLISRKLGLLPAGMHTFSQPVNILPKGVYTVIFRAEEKVSIKKLMIE